MNDKVTMLGLTSFNIEEWLREEMGCHRFTNMARDRFQEVRYTMVSALGTQNQADQSPLPLRVLDPFIWILEYGLQNSSPDASKSIWERIRDWLSTSRKPKVPSLNPKPKS